MESTSYPAVKPLCGRCMRAVDEAKCEKIPQGMKLIYSCHGETKEFLITTDWYDGLVKYEQPFVKVVFSPLPVIAPTKEQMILDDAVLKMRENRKLVSEFIEKTIRDVVAQQSTFTGDVSQFANDTSLRLESVYADLQDHSVDVRQLVIGTKTVLGRFELPFFPDATEMKWTPTVTAKKGKK